MPTRSLEPLEVGSIQVPYYFRCPISLDLMRDPVTVSTGHTYDRSSIDTWISTGNTTCPVTRVPLTDLSFIPNHSLRRLIQDWCVSNRSSGIERIPTPKQPADPVTVRELLHQASSLESTPVSYRVSALRKLRGLVRDSEKNRVLVSGQGASEVLVSVLFSESEFSNDNINNYYYQEQVEVLDQNEVKDEALALISILSLSEHECVRIAQDPSCVEYLVSRMFHSSIDVRVSSAAVIEMVISGTGSSELRGNITECERIFEGVVGIIKYYPSSGYQRALRVGVRALLVLCLVKHTRHRAVDSGAPEALIDKIADLEKCDMERALAATELLCRTPSGCAAFAAHALTVPVLVKSVLKVSDRATEFAAGTLCSLCAGSEECRREAVAAGVMTQMLLVVQSECTARAKKKAQILLKLLRDSWPEHTMGKSEEYYGWSDIVPF